MITPTQLPYILESLIVDYISVDSSTFYNCFHLYFNPNGNLRSNEFIGIFEYVSTLNNFFHLEVMISTTFSLLGYTTVPVSVK